MWKAEGSVGEAPLPGHVLGRGSLKPLGGRGSHQAVHWSQVALNMVADSVLVFSTPTARLADVNLAACKHLGFSSQKLRRMSLVEVAPDAASGDLGRCIAHVMRGRLRDAHLRTVYRHRDTRLLPVQCSIRALQHRSNKLFLAVARFQNAENQSRGPVFSAPVLDPLTGLPNRDWLFQQLELAAGASQRSDLRYAVLFIDVDRFKQVNDSFGHLVGDQVLQAVAHRLTESVRPGDTVVRYGGDEFVVLMKVAPSTKSMARIAARIGRGVNVDGIAPGGGAWRVRVTMSIGVADCHVGGCSPLAAINCADQAMYRAKSLGRNGQHVLDAMPT